MSGPSAKDGVVGQSDGDPKTIRTTAGNQFQIHLWEDRTRGELWVPSYDASLLVLVNDEFLRIANGNAVDSGRRTFEFRAVAAGTHRVVFEKRMGWKFTAEDRRVYLVEASDGTGRAERPVG
ncbi:MAG: protease inhibitor I42 family protein [Nitrospiraceae bacterium]